MDIKNIGQEIKFGEDKFALRTTRTAERQNNNSLTTTELMQIDLDKVDLPEKVRKLKNKELTVYGTLRKSIKMFGQLSPITVFFDPTDENSEGQYQLIDGMKRFQIAQELEQKSIFALVLYNTNKEVIHFYRALLNLKSEEEIDAKIESAKSLLKETDFFENSEISISNLFGLDNGDFERFNEFMSKYLEICEDETFINGQRETVGLVKTALFEGSLSPKLALKMLQMCSDKSKKLKEKAKKRKEREEKKAKAKEEEAKLDDGDAIPQGKGDETDEGVLSISKGNHQQFVGDERQTLPPSLVRQIYARDESQCMICGYGQDNYSVSPQLEKHHIIDVQYTGNDNIKNLVLLCKNCHSLVTNFLNGKANEYSPTPDDLKRHPENWGVVVLGNMGKIAKAKAMQRIKAQDEKDYQKIKEGKITVGQAIKKIKLPYACPKEFNDDPYEFFCKSLFYLMKHKEGFEIHNLKLLNNYNELMQDDSIKFNKYVNDIVETLPEPKEVNKVKEVNDIAENLSVTEEVNENQDLT